MAKADSGTASTESGIDVGVIERTVERTGVDGVRAYRVPESVCDDLLAEFAFTDDVTAALEHAHTEQAKLLFAKSVRGNDNFDAEECGIVIGIDTAEQF